MMRKKLEWLKRGICLTLAGTLILCSDNVSYAATTATELVSETEAEENTASVGKNTENTEDTSEENAGEEASGGTTSAGTEAVSGTETPVGEADSSETETEDDTEIEAAAETENAGEGTEPGTETTGGSGGVETTEVSTETETTEASTETETTETSTETETETTEETTEETETKGEKVPNGITLNVQSKYKEISIGEEISLPEYTIQYADPAAAGSEAQAEWSTDGLGIVSLDVVNGKVKAEKAGVTVLNLTVKDTDIYT